MSLKVSVECKIELRGLNDTKQQINFKQKLKKNHIFTGSGLVEYQALPSLSFHEHYQPLFHLSKVSNRIQSFNKSFLYINKATKKNPLLNRLHESTYIFILQRIIFNKKDNFKMNKKGKD